MLKICYTLLGVILISFQTYSVKKRNDIKPNVIFFLVDDLGWKDMSHAGSDFYETPNIDKLAKSGVRFTNAYAAHPRCVPSRYAIMTGQYPARAGIPEEHSELGLSEITLGEAMQRNGYTTFFTGKWHLGHNPSHWPQNQGFDINIGGCSAGAPISYFAPYNVLKRQSNHRARQIVGMDNVPDGTYITDHITNVTIDFIESNQSNPFFAVVAHYAVHTPIEAKTAIVDKYKKKLASMEFEGEDFILSTDGRQKMHQNDPVYAAMIESVDQSLGKIVRKLEEEELLENTIIIVTSDHGGLSNSGLNNKRRLATSNSPLRAGKGHCYEGGIKVPTIIYWNNNLKPNTIIDHVTITNTDFYPSILEMVGAEPLPQQHIDGVSFVPAFNGRNINKKRLFFWHSPKARPASTGDNNCTVVRKGKYKLIHFYDLNRIELYDLNKDPYEKDDLSKAKPAKTKEYLKLIAAWKKEISAFEAN